MSYHVLNVVSCFLEILEPDRHEPMRHVCLVLGTHWWRTATYLTSASLSPEERCMLCWRVEASTITRITRIAKKKLIGTGSSWLWFLVSGLFWIILDSRPEYSQCCHQDRGHHQIHHRRKEFSVSEISFRSSSELKPEGFNGWEEKEKHSPFLGSWAAGQLVSNKDNKVS